MKATQLDDASSSSFPTERSWVHRSLVERNHYALALLRQRYGAERVVPATILGEFERIAPGQSCTDRHSPRSRSPNAGGRPRRRDGGATTSRRRLPIRRRRGDASVGQARRARSVALSTSAAAAPIGDVIASATWRPLLERTHEEACAVAEACGARIDRRRRAACSSHFLRACAARCKRTSTLGAPSSSTRSRGRSCAASSARPRRRRDGDARRARAGTNGVRAARLSGDRCICAGQPGTVALVTTTPLP